MTRSLCTTAAVYDLSHRPGFMWWHFPWSTSTWSLTQPSKGCDTQVRLQCMGIFDMSAWVRKPRITEHCRHIHWGWLEYLPAPPHRWWTSDLDCHNATLKTKYYDEAGCWQNMIGEDASIDSWSSRRSRYRKRCGWITRSTIKDENLLTYSRITGSSTCSTSDEYVTYLIEPSVSTCLLYYSICTIVNKQTPWKGE